MLKNQIPLTLLGRSKYAEYHAKYDECDIDYVQTIASRLIQNLWDLQNHLNFYDEIEKQRRLEPCEKKLLESYKSGFKQLQSTLEMTGILIYLEGYYSELESSSEDSTAQATYENTRLTY